VYCSGCHGEDGRGARYVPAGLDRPNVIFDRSYFQRQDPEVLRANVWHMLEREGREMPHLRRRLSDAEARAIIEFLRQSDARGPAPTP
jgi:mono/diheme cytochrome c family protein